MGSPKVSVIIASYNHEKYVVESIKSVLQQTYQDFEIVITDDGSNDTTVDQIRNIRDSRIRLFCFDINQGACAAMNNCLRHASCEYIAVLNSDDIWMPTKLELQIDYLQRNPDVAAVFSNALFVDERGQDFSRRERPEFFNIFEQQNRSQGQWLRKFFTEGNCLCHPSLLIRKECYDVLGLYDNRYRQLPDFDMWIRFCKKYRLHVMPDKLVKFRLLPEGQNASNQIKPNRIRNTNEFYFIMQRFFDDMPVDFFTDGFAEFVRNPDFQGLEEYECEKVFVYLDSNVPWAAKCYRLIAFQKMHQLLSEDSFRRVLQEKYSFGDKSFMALSSSLDFLDSQLWNNSGNQYIPAVPLLNTNELPSYRHDNENSVVELTISLENTRRELLRVYASYPWKIGWAIISPARRLIKLLTTLRHTSDTLRQKIISKIRSRWDIFRPGAASPAKHGRRTKKSCPVCGILVTGFSPMYESYLKLVSDNHFMYPLSDFETLNLDQYACSNCGASDRDRLYALFADLKFRGLDKSRKYRCIEFAPSAPLSKFLRQTSFLEYRSADLFMEGVDDKVDLMDMKQYIDDSVDIFICSHVLEHVSDDRKALRELHRILKKGGWGIVMVPILLSIDAVQENPGIATEAARWKYFGQGDHVRLYSKKGFLERLKDAGFKVHEYGAAYFGTEEFENCGIHLQAVLYVVEK